MLCGLLRHFAQVGRVWLTGFPRRLPWCLRAAYSVASASVRIFGAGLRLKQEVPRAAEPVPPLPPPPLGQLFHFLPSRKTIFTFFLASFLERPSRTPPADLPASRSARRPISRARPSAILPMTQSAFFFACLLGGSLVRRCAAAARLFASSLLLHWCSAQKQQ